MKNIINSLAYTVLGFSHVSEAFHISSGSMELFVAVAYWIIAISYLLRLLSSK